MRKPIRSCLFSLALLYVPLANPDLWHTFSIGEIPQHWVSFSKEGMSISVNGSGGPIILPLSETVKVRSLKIRGKLRDGGSQGPLNLKSKKQGVDEGADDFALRVGLVVPGKRSLSFLERQVAPNWVLDLLELAPQGSGIDHICFLNAVQQDSLLGRERTHPASDLIKEKFTWLLKKNGPFEFEYNFDQIIQVGAIWIAVDGDDTHSNFSIDIEELVIGTDVAQPLRSG